MESEVLEKEVGKCLEVLENNLKRQVLEAEFSSADSEEELTRLVEELAHVDGLILELDPVLGDVKDEESLDLGKGNDRKTITVVNKQRSKIKKAMVEREQRVIEHLLEGRDLTPLQERADELLES